MTAQSHQGIATELRRRGWAVLPAPRQVALGSGTVRLDATWHLETADVPADDVAVETLVEGLRSEHALALGAGPAGGATLRLSVRPGAVRTDADGDCDRQAYSLRIAPGRIDLLGNAPPGLFYGVQTLLQLLAGDGRERLALPEAAIADWPEYALRFVHWDTKHHQDRVETLRRFLDWMGRFKLNAVSFELEDKFEYPSHPVIGAPGAFTAAQMQELVRYGLRRHIQIVPNVQAPAHMCYVLKHDQFAHLRCDGSNYQICMDDPDARRLIFDMYDDLCRATQGVDYFHVSTDEVYYAGICERYRRPYNPVNRSLTWVDFVNAAHGFLAERGRRIIIWSEFPLLPEHVELLPADVIDGILGFGKGHDMVQAEDDLGMRQFAYAAIQGEEKLFPGYFAGVDRTGRHVPGKLAGPFRAARRRGARAGRPIGTFAAAWDDAGPHNETFWLGWAVMAQGGWTPEATALEQTVADFMDVFYGREADDMVEVYRDLQSQAQFWESSWDRRPSRVRGPAYGDSHARRPVTRSDMTLLPPALPSLPDLACRPVFRARYGELLTEVPRRLSDNDRLLGRLYANLARARRGRYNIEVLISLARFQRRHLEMLLGLTEAEDLLVQAASAGEDRRHDQAVALMTRAHTRVGELIDDTYDTYRMLTDVWERAHLPRNAPAGGREFLHVMDDVKDHFADRRADLSYHIAPFESIALEPWREALGEVIRSYAPAAGPPAPQQ